MISSKDREEHRSKAGLPESTYRFAKPSKPARAVAIRLAISVISVCSVVMVDSAGYFLFCFCAGVYSNQSPGLTENICDQYHRASARPEMADKSKMGIAFIVREAEVDGQKYRQVAIWLGDWNIRSVNPA